MLYEQTKNRKILISWVCCISWNWDIQWLTFVGFFVCVQYLMVKFLCTRQDTAERLGVQGLNILGYLRAAGGEPSRSMNCLKCKKPDNDAICGTSLLLKTLYFIQQLAQDLVCFPHCWSTALKHMVTMLQTYFMIHKGQAKNTTKII